MDQTWQAETLTETEERSAGGHLKEMSRRCDQVRSHDSRGSFHTAKMALSSSLPFDQLELEGIPEKTKSNKQYILITSYSF